MLLNSQWIIEEIKEEIIETDDNEGTTIPNLSDPATAVLRGTFIAMQTGF